MANKTETAGYARTLDAARSETVFEDFKEPYNKGQAVAEANRCLFCTDAPCIKACPTSIDIPQFIRKIATDNIRGSAKTIFDSNIHGMSCARVCPVEVLCVGDCVYNEMDMPPIQIGKLQRYATDAAYAAGMQFYEAAAPTGKKVAIVGGGPASLACAHMLRRHGHACTVFEKHRVLGGLNTTGVAPYKMRADKSLEEAAWILSIGGIEIRSGVTVGTDVSWADLERDFDAVFVGLGLGADSRLGVPGEDLGSIYGAVDFIERMKLGQMNVRSVKHAVVVGGGNTAIDAVRELVGLGIPSVSMLYRGVREQMSGYEHEFEAGVSEGVKGVWQTQPVAFEGASSSGRGDVQRIRAVKLDDKKKPIAGSDHVIDADLVLLAIGQAKLGELLGGLDGIKLDKGRIVVDADGFTGRAKYWAGGDCANGGKEVVNASAEGKRAANAIHTALTGASKNAGGAATNVGGARA
jgi:dihydropyrimidine dehydrogenase (NAD+) subunit PreT